MGVIQHEAYGSQVRNKERTTEPGIAGRHDTERPPQHHRPNPSQNAGRRFFRAYHFPDRDKSDAPDESGNRSDSIWAVVAGTVKAFNLPIDYVLYELSYANLTLYGASLPSYKSPKDKKDKGDQQENIDAGDPKNKEKVRAFLDSID